MTLYGLSAIRRNTNVETNTARCTFGVVGNRIPESINLIMCCLYSAKKHLGIIIGYRLTLYVDQKSELCARLRRLETEDGGLVRHGASSTAIIIDSDDWRLPCNALLAI